MFLMKLMSCVFFILLALVSYSSVAKNFERDFIEAAIDRTKQVIHYDGLYGDFDNYSNS